MGKGIKTILIIIAVLIVGCGGLAVYVLMMPEEQPVVPEQLAEQQEEPVIYEETPDPVNFQEETEPVETEPSEDVLPDGIYNILFVGTDSRTADETSAEGLSDSMMVVSFNTNTNKIVLVSFMRDSWVQRIGKNSSFKGKLNAAYKAGGALELMDTLNLNFEFDIKHYVATGYDGFGMLIDELGGVDVEVTSEEAYLINWRSADIPQAGDKSKRESLLKSLGRPILEENYEGTKKQHLNGYQALWYARNRTSPAADGTKGSDAIRINRQQLLMELIYEKVKTEKTLDAAVALFKFGIQHVHTNMDIITMTKLGTRILRADKIEFVNVRVPFPGTSRSGNSEKGEDPSALVFDLDEAGRMIDAILYEAAF